jgi:hypothetical protein
MRPHGQRHALKNYGIRQAVAGGSVIEKRRRRPDETRRARLYLAQLAWLDGFPTDAGWWHLDADGPIALDGAQISKARRTARTVMREYPSALRAVVGDVDRWWQIVDSKLAWCSAVATGKRASAFEPELYLTPRLARMLAQLRAGALGYAANAIATAWVADMTRVERGL